MSVQRTHHIEDSSGLLSKRRRLNNAFWENAEAQMRQVVDWLADPKTLGRLEQIFSENIEADFADALAKAIDRLAAVQRGLAQI